MRSDVLLNTRSMFDNRPRFAWLATLTLGLSAVLPSCTRRPPPASFAPVTAAPNTFDVRPAAGLSVEVVTLEDLAEEAEDAGDFGTCAKLREQSADRTRGMERASVLRGAARCYARAGRHDDALRDVANALEERAGMVASIESDAVLEPLNSKPGWKTAIARARTRVQVEDDKQIFALFNADQADRNKDPKDIDFKILDTRDEERREALGRIMAHHRAWTPADLYHAAMVLQHAREPDAFLRAHTLCLQAVALDPTYGDALRLAAASLDRYLMVQGRPQHFGTQIVNTDGTWRLFDVGSTMNDDQRAAWGVRPLAAQREMATKMNAGL